MKQSIKPTAGILFILSVFIPSLFLGYFALRAVDREEAYIEKRFEDTLLSEVVHTTSVIQNELEKIKDELGAIFHEISIENLDEIPHIAEEKNTLIGIPFLVTEDYNIIRPDGGNKISKGDDEFLVNNEEFLANEVSIPVYENIAIAYKDIIINEQHANKDTYTNSNDVESSSKFEKIFPNDDEWFNEEYLNQNVKIQFEKDENVRSRVYEQAVEEGNKLSMRNVIPSQKKEANPESIYISRHLTFSEITEGRDIGIIPRIIEGSLTLFFWVKTASGNIAGATLRDAVFEDRLLKCIQLVYTEVRILTILDEDGIPLVVPNENIERNWKIPFVSREISEILPRWEVAVYLTNPDMIASQARSIAVVMWTLIFILIISIITGGILVLKSIYSEIILAQQKTTFVSNVSHELKTPLTSIRLFAEMLKQERQPDKEKQKKYLGLMVSETERLTRLIGNVLDFSKMDRKKKQYTMEKTDITSLCSTIMDNQRLGLEQKGFLVDFSASTDKAVVYVDRGSIKQALLNLISNAEKYSAEKKEIKMELSTLNGYVRIMIKDRGIGIPARYVKKIFTEFYRVDDSLTSRVRGSGLGLAIAKKIIASHNGTIEYTHHEGGGSIFIVTLPIVEPGEENEER